MAHIMGKTFVSDDRVVSIDESGNNFEKSASIKAVTPVVSVGHYTDADFRLYVGTSDGNIAIFADQGSLQSYNLFHVTDQPIAFSLYHAAETIFLGTGDILHPGSCQLLALNDSTFALRWQASSPGPVLYPVGVAYQGNTPRQVIVASGNPSPALRALDVATGAETWRVSDYSLFGIRVHNGVVYYANLGDSTLKARSASTGELLWSFQTPQKTNFNTPIVAGGVVWASTVSDQIFALRASDGSMLWQAGGVLHPGAPAIGFDHPGGLAFVAVAEQSGISPGFLKAFDANTGEPLWTSNVPVTPPGGSDTDPIQIPHFENGIQVQLGTFDGKLMTFNPYNGTLAWERVINPGSVIAAKPHWVAW